MFIGPSLPTAPPGLPDPEGRPEQRKASGKLIYGDIEGVIRKFHLKFFDRSVCIGVVRSL